MEREDKETDLEILEILNRLGARRGQPPTDNLVEYDLEKMRGDPGSLRLRQMYIDALRRLVERYEAEADQLDKEQELRSEDS